MLDKFCIEILLYIPPSSLTFKEELESAIENALEISNLNIKAKFVTELSTKTQVVISLVSEKLGESDKEFYNKYQDNKLKFLFFYFQDVMVDIADIDDDIYQRIEFKDEISTNINIYNEFEFINDLKDKIALNIQESISDIVDRTNHSKINTMVLTRSKGSKFFDHNNNLRKVDNFLRREKRISLINGLGGVGKTTLAIEYAVQSLQNKIYDYVIWLDVQNGINKELQTFTISYLVSNTDDGKQGKEYYDRKFNDFIIEHPNTLIIIDNYENRLKELSEFINKYKQLDIIITSREKIPTLNIHLIELEVFQDINDALEMFLLYSTRIYQLDEKEVLKEIIEHLGKLPLALEITANFLSDSGMCVENYLTAFKNESINIFDKLEDYKPEFHLENLRATLKINDRIINNNNSLNILKVFAIISPEPIEKDLIEKYLMNCLDISEFDRVVSLKDLEKFSYIKKLNDNYSMHRLLQEVIRIEYFMEKDNFQEEIITKLSLAIFHWFANAALNSKYGSYFSQIMQHIDFLLEKWKNLNIYEAKAYLYTCISRYIETIRMNKEDILVNMEEAIKLIENITIENDDKTIIFSQYARALSLNKKYSHAEKVNKEVMNLSDNPMIRANVFANMGTLYTDMEIYDKAIEYFEKALSILKTDISGNNTVIGVIYNNLANAHERKRDYKKAEILYREALNIYFTYFEKVHPEIGTTFTNLAISYNNQKRYLQSFKNVYIALDIQLNLELSPVNIKRIEDNFSLISFVKRFLKADKNEKVIINRQIDKLNQLFIDKKFKKMKIAKLK